VRILVTFAVEAEFSSWRKSRKFVAGKRGNVPFYTAEVGVAKVDVVLTGMGPENARRAVETVLSPEHAACISSGFAGALNADYGVADVLVAGAVRQPGDAETIASDAALVESALHANGAVEVKSFVSVESVVETPQEKANLARFGAAVEMESYAILAVARGRKVPAVAIRAISDRFDQKLPMDFSGTVDQCGHVLKGKLARQIASNPSRIPALIRLGKQSQLAASRLAEFLESYIERLAAQESGAANGNIGFEKVAHH
jgi:adenosylhomocysteine nucleosidase